MSDKARVLTFGFTNTENERIDRRFSDLGVPAPVRLEKRHGSVVIGDILQHGTIGTEEVECPERLSRLTTFFRLFMLIPQVFVIVFIYIAAWLVMFLSWWAILFTARYSAVFFRFVVWWLRWGARLLGYMCLLTDKYPPFGGGE